MPSDAPARYMVEKAVARYQLKRAADDANADMKETPKQLSVALDPAQKQTLETGRPPEQAKMIDGLPENAQWDVLESLAAGYPAAHVCNALLRNCAARFRCSTVRSRW